jgi:hypothetical protein
MRIGTSTPNAATQVKRPNRLKNKSNRTFGSDGLALPSSKVGGADGSLRHLLLLPQKHFNYSSIIILLEQLVLPSPYQALYCQLNHHTLIQLRCRRHRSMADDNDELPLFLMGVGVT